MGSGHHSLNQSVIIPYYFNRSIVQGRTLPAKRTILSSMEGQ